MANIKYFSDYNGETVELTRIESMANKVFAEKFPAIKGFRYDGFTKVVGKASPQGELLPVTRKIEYKSQPSRHECNSKCLNGRHNGVCECRCGGKNHGRGMFTSLIEKDGQAELLG